MRSRPIVNHCLHFGRVVALISVIGLLSLWICTPLAQAQNDEPSTAIGQFSTYIDPYWGFAVLYPTDWAIQAFPYKDFGFRISSPGIITDELGDLLDGAFIAVNVFADASGEAGRALLDNLGTQSDAILSPVIQGRQWTQLSIVDTLGNSTCIGS